MGQGARDGGKTHLQEIGHGAAGGGHRDCGSWLGICMGRRNGKDGTLVRPWRGIQKISRLDEGGQVGQAGEGRGQV